MSSEIDARLASLGISLPHAAAPAANYLPYVQSGNMLHISGQLPLENGKVAVTGQLGAGVHTADGQRAAELCAVNILAQAKAALAQAQSQVADLMQGKRPEEIEMVRASLNSARAQATEARRVLKQAVPALITTADFSEDLAQVARGSHMEVMRKPVKPAQLRALMAHMLA